MKYLCVYLLLILSTPLFSQETYEELDEKAWNEYENESYASAIETFKGLLEKFPEQNYSTNLYNIACCYALDNQINDSYFYLNKSLENGFWERASLIRTDSDLNSIREDARWLNIESYIEEHIELKIKEVKEHNNKFKGSLHYKKLNKLSGKQLYSALKELNSFEFYRTDSAEFISFWHHYNDTTEVPYLVQLPSGYNSSEKHPMLFQLHGGIWHIEDYPLYLGEGATQGFDRFVSKWADENGYILVIPMATKYVNWLYPNDGIDLLPRLLSEVKSRFNISDNHVFINGHSNGGSGSFSYCMKRPSEFAGFFGFNTNPKVYTGGTFLHNLSNRMFHNVSTDLDYYFPQTGNDSLLRICSDLSLSYTNDFYPGFPHWFPEFDESEAPTIKIFEMANGIQRNPFPNDIYWECDDLKNNQCDWLIIEKLDTLAEKQDWHQHVNFKVPEWRDVEEETKILEGVIKDAFKFPNKSGAVNASFEDNVFTIEASRVAEIKLLISPEMVDLNKPITVVINGKTREEVLVTIDTEILRKGFEHTHDRTALWVNEIVMEID